MKNILAENLLRFGVKNLSKTQKDILHILTEQSAAWESVPQQGKDPGSLKTVLLDYPSQPFLDPSTGMQWFVDNTGGAGEKKALGMNIGARLVMRYTANMKVNQIEDNNSLKQRFTYYIEFFLAPEAGLTGKDISSHEPGTKQAPSGLSHAAVWLLNVKANQSKDGKMKFAASVPSTWTTEKGASRVSVYPLKDATDQTRTNRKSLVELGTLNQGFASNPVGFSGNLISKINTDLLKYGYPKLPNPIASQTLSA